MFTMISNWSWAKGLAASEELAMGTGLHVGAIA